MGIPVTKAELNHEGLLLARKVENLQKHITKLKAKNKKYAGVVEAAEKVSSNKFHIRLADYGDNGLGVRKEDLKALETKLNALKGLGGKP